jgi:hypothetical protein
VGVITLSEVSENQGEADTASLHKLESPAPKRTSLGHSGPPHLRDDSERSAVRRARMLDLAWSMSPDNIVRPRRGIFCGAETAVRFVVECIERER